MQTPYTSKQHSVAVQVPPMRPHVRGVGLSSSANAFAMLSGLPMSHEAPPPPLEELELLDDVLPPLDEVLPPLDDDVLPPLDDVLPPLDEVLLPPLEEDSPLDELVLELLG